MRSDDLVPLLAEPKGKSVGFRQGVVVSWNPDTAENTVLVGGTVLENLPILNTSEANILATGDVVSILTSGSTWGILGRMTIPGTSQAASSLTALKTYSDSVAAGETTVSTSYTNLTTPGPAVTARIGASGRALVIVSCIVEGSSDVGDLIEFGGSEMGYEMTGANSLTATANSNNAARVEIGIEKVSGANPGYYMTSLISASRVSLQEGLNPGDTTLTAKYRLNIGVIARFTGRNITVMVL